MGRTVRGTVRYLYCHKRTVSRTTVIPIGMDEQSGPPITLTVVFPVRSNDDRDICILGSLRRHMI